MGSSQEVLTREISGKGRNVVSKNIRLEQSSEEIGSQYDRVTKSSLPLKTAIWETGDIENWRVDAAQLRCDFTLHAAIRRQDPTYPFR